MHMMHMMHMVHMMHMMLMMYMIHTMRMMHMKVTRRIVAIETRQGTSQISGKHNFSI